MNKFEVYKNIALRPFEATKMLWNHNRTLKYLWKQGKYKNFYNHIFTTYFIRGEDCGKGVLDPIWKLTGKAPFLWDLEIETTTRCYLRCIHCEHTYWEDKSYLNQDLKFDTFKRVIDRISNLHWINMTGEGSSFLNQDFLDMVHYAKNKGIYVDFSHDFYKLDEATMSRLIAIGVDRIYWSFDSVRPWNYGKIRVGSDLSAVVKNVQKLVELKKQFKSPLPEICFRFCFFKDNIDEVVLVPTFLRGIVDNVKDYGDEPSINLVALLEFEKTKGWEVEIPEDVRVQVDKDSKLYGFKNYWSHVAHVEEEKPPLDYCTFWSEPYIMITGHVVPCCAVLMSNKRERLERLAFGNINEKALKDIWNDSYYKEFRKQLVNPKRPVPEVCEGCRVFNTKNRIKRFGVGDDFDVLPNGKVIK